MTPRAKPAVPATEVPACEHNVYAVLRSPTPHIPFTLFETRLETPSNFSFPTLIFDCPTYRYTTMLALTRTHTPDAHRADLGVNSESTFAQNGSAASSNAVHFRALALVRTVGTVGQTVGLSDRLSDDCRNLYLYLSEPVREARNLSEPVGTCRNLSDCRTARSGCEGARPPMAPVGHCRTPVGPCRTVGRLSDCRTCRTCG